MEYGTFYIFNLRIWVENTLFRLSDCGVPRCECIINTYTYIYINIDVYTHISPLAQEGRKVMGFLAHPTRSLPFS